MPEGEREEGGQEEGGQEVLAAFFRGKPGGVEQVRIVAGLYHGRHLTHLRTFFQAQPPTPDDDGWRPSKIGVVIREGELDAAIAALELVRRAVQAEGRSTCPARPGERNSRPRQIASAERAARSGEPLTPRQQKILDQSAANRATGRGPTPKPQAPKETQLDALDDLAPWR